mgnify:CR=1 FL=1
MTPATHEPTSSPHAASVRNLQVLLGPLAGAAFAFLTFWLLFSAPARDPVLAAPLLHFWLVSFISLLAAVVALLVGIAGARVADARVVYLSAGFTGLAGLFALHGLATPGVWVTTYDLSAIATQLSMIAFAGWMVAASYLHPNSSHRGLRRLLLGWAGAIVLFDALLLLRPELARFVPVQLAPLKFAAAALVVCMLLVAGWRFLQSYRLSRSPIHLMMLHVVGWVMVSQVIIVLGELFRLSWWLYHLILFAAVATMLVTFVRQMRTGQLGSSLAALVDDDVGRRVSYGFRPEVRALVVATEARDPYTAGHMQRVAATSLALGKELGLPPEALRVLGQAGVVHDVGKLEVPDQVLNKHGPLTPEERALIEAHPVVGERIARTLGLNRQELEVIRHHHERWDGSGYPDRLAGEAIPLLARVTSVADVYDAMSSARAYRPAWSPEKVTALIEREAGVGFDPQVARAMLEMLARDRPSPPEAPAGAGPVADPAR